MSMIYNIDLLTDRYKDNNFKNREIKAFEIKYPEARVIRDNYDREEELEEDWQKYCELPYHLKVLCNELSLRLFGCKNEQNYIRIKAELVQKDIDNASYIANTYIPMGFKEAVEDELLIKQAKEYMNSGGHPILLANYDNLADLNTDWYNFNNQCYDYKVISNNKSLEIYGKTVPEVYQKEVKKFLSKDIKGSSLDDLTTHPVVTDSLSATEAVLDNIASTLDNAEAIMLLELALRQISTPVENTMVDVMANTLQNYIQEKENFQENYLGMYNYLLPWEIMGLFENVEDLYHDEMFMNYYARGIGLKPPMKNFQESVRRMLLLEENKENLIKIGWNSVLDSTNVNYHPIAASRANSVLREYCKYWFFNLENTPNLLTESEIDSSFHKGISILVIQELDKDNENKIVDIPKVLVTLDYRDSAWFPIIYGEISSMAQSIDGIISNFKIPVVNCYFLHLNDDLYEKIRSINLEEFNRSNEIKRICSILQMACPEIANKKLFITYLLSSIMHSKFGDGVFPLRFDHDCPKEIVVMLCSKLFGNYNDIRQSYSKLNLFDKERADLQETYILKDSKLIADTIYEDKDYIGITDFSKDQVYNETWNDFKFLLNTKLN